jgi:hypothetical protein
MPDGVERDERAKAPEGPVGAGAGGYTPLERTERRLVMGIGVSVFVLAAGAILAFAVHLPSNGISLDTVGVILIVLGLGGLLASLVFWDPWTPRRRVFSYNDGTELVIHRRRPRVVDLDDGVDPVVEIVEDRPVVERRGVTTRRTTYDGC